MIVDTRLTGSDWADSLIPFLSRRIGRGHKWDSEDSEIMEDCTVILTTYLSSATATVRKLANSSGKWEITKDRCIY